ncbi:hypothetical protein M405DRAFT_860620 [Rhizopogon salebrosus TDB-379]|nr:hypothetical protein M405DRAFT_860620 [Rhizopogon salebrosus TDB-379]
MLRDAFRCSQVSAFLHFLNSQRLDDGPALGPAVSRHSNVKLRALFCIRDAVGGVEAVGIRPQPSLRICSNRPPVSMQQHLPSPSFPAFGILILLMKIIMPVPEIKEV